MIEPETLMAYADGTLDPIRARRVERAIASDPALGEEVARHRRLTATLRAHYAPIAQAEAPADLEAMVRDRAKLVPLESAAPKRPAGARLIWAGAIAASLVVGLFAGSMLPLTGAGDGIALVGERALARGDVADALDTQLAATQVPGAPVRIGVTFRDATQRLCRTFERGEMGGIACAAGSDWEIERLYGGVARQGSAYRQAGSATAAMMADAQAMMVGEPLDAAQEADAVGARGR